MLVEDEVVAECVEVVAPDPVLDADAAIAESVESLLGSVRGITNDADADADDGAEGGVNVRGKGVVMGGGGCACAAIAVLCSRVYGHAREMWEAKRSESREARSDRLGSVSQRVSQIRVESRGELEGKAEEG